MTRTKTQGNSADFPSDATHCDVTVDKKAHKAMENVKAKYGHADTTVIFRAADQRHLLIRINCTVPGCKAQRIVATSDLFQTRTCVDHKGWDKTVAPKASKMEKAPRKGSKSKDAPKVPSKVPSKVRGQRKGTPRGRKAKNASITTAKGE